MEGAVLFGGGQGSFEEVTWVRDQNKAMEVSSPDGMFHVDNPDSETKCRKSHTHTHRKKENRICLKTPKSNHSPREKGSLTCRRGQKTEGLARKLTLRGWKPELSF